MQELLHKRSADGEWVRFKLNFPVALRGNLQ
jgi:hypothetical protein